jgi:hypothetical protein
LAAFEVITEAKEVGFGGIDLTFIVVSCLRLLTGLFDPILPNRPNMGNRRAGAGMTASCKAV